MRAAFKAAAAGKQVLVLVPTTILAQQHLATFRERFGDLPVTRRHGQPLPHAGRDHARCSRASATGGSTS